jgi:hypothetical protein
MYIDRHADRGRRLDRSLASGQTRLSPQLRPDELERQLRERLNALGPAPRAELLHVLTLPDLDGAGAIQSYWGTPKRGRSLSC